MREDEKDKKTPIIDGDARPDMNVHGDIKEEQEPKTGKAGSKRKAATTQNRTDTNSLEDFRDAKQE